MAEFRGGDVVVVPMPATVGAVEIPTAPETIVWALPGPRGEVPYTEVENLVNQEVGDRIGQMETLRNTAQSAANTATTKASEAASSASAAASSASTASTKAGEAATSASNALSYRNTASTHASTATTKATEASNSANAASSSATAAAGSATAADGSADAAAGSASAAATSASNAANSASTANTRANAAAGSATAAATSASNAANSANAADQRAVDANNSAITASNHRNAVAALRDDVEDLAELAEDYATSFGLSASSTTGAAGSNATVTVTGTGPSYSLNFKIPRGDKGDPGDVSVAQMNAAILEAKSTNYGYRYKTSITLYGEHDKYYPVVIMAGDQTVKRDIMVKRSYGELHPPEWNNPTHGGGLTVKIRTNFGGWGGANYSWEVHELEEMYNPTFGGAQLVTHNMGFAVMLRGGGTTGAIYHLYSDQPVQGSHSTTGVQYPAIYYENDLVQYPNGSPYNWRMPAPLSEPNAEAIRTRQFITLAQETDQALATKADKAEVTSAVANVKAEILGGVGPAFDTLAELKEAYEGADAGLQTLIGTKADKTDPRFTDARTPKAHTHVISDITGLQAQLGNAANLSGAVTDNVDLSLGETSWYSYDTRTSVTSSLAAALDAVGYNAHMANQNTGEIYTALSDLYENKANASHTHSIANVSGLQSALDEKASANHTHTPGSLGAIAASGAAATLWAGSQAAYDALPAATRNAIGFVAVIV